MKRTKRRTLVILLAALIVAGALFEGMKRDVAGLVARAERHHAEVEIRWGARLPADLVAIDLDPRTSLPLSGVVLFPDGRAAAGAQVVVRLGAEHFTADAGLDGRFTVHVPRDAERVEVCARHRDTAGVRHLAPFHPVRPAAGELRLELLSYD